jgi:carbamoyltransferase
MRILAFNIAHDSSVCAINDGKLEFFCKEERLSRIKRDSHPFKSLDLYRSLNFGKVDHVLYSVPSNIEPDIEITYRQYVRKNFNVQMENFSGLLHHSCHASLAYYNSGFKKALVFVIDRNGSIFFVNGSPVARESESVFMCNEYLELNPIHKSFWLYDGVDIQKNIIRKELHQCYPNCEIVASSRMGIVKVYEAATTLIGQNALENGKTMGLSSYGNDVKESLFHDNIPLDYQFVDLGLESVHFSGLESKITKNLTKDNYQFYADKAKQVQTQTQEVALNLIRKYVELTGITNVCIVGGYGLNVVANNYYIKNLPHVNFYFEPVADDTGVPIGAAMLKYRMLTSKPIQPLKNNFYHYYDDEEKIKVGRESSIDEVCDMLINQKSVAIFQGSPEAGPRALGHRSILFDPRNQNGKDIVNQIKKREWYRPFAGIILESEFEKYFETLGIKSSPYMTINFDGKDGTKEFVPAIMHVDNSCRVQTVSEGFLFELLTKFYEKTGCPMLLNTSFNLAGEALVQTKQDALHTLNQSNLNAVYFVDENKIVLNGE